MVESIPDTASVFRTCFGSPRATDLDLATSGDVTNGTSLLKDGTVEHELWSNWIASYRRKLELYVKSLS